MLKALVVFVLDGQQIALSLSSVQRVVRIVEITPLLNAPGIVCGAINLQGMVVPVLNIRKRFRFPEREISLSDHLIIARTSRRTVALLVDDASRVIETARKDVIESEKILPSLDYVEGVVKLEDGMILIHDLNRFLSLDEENTLDNALRRDQA